MSKRGRLDRLGSALKAAIDVVTGDSFEQSMHAKLAELDRKTAK